MKRKRVVIISDFHCGHLVGLTPPDWQGQERAGRKRHSKWAAIQRECWQRYMELAKELRPVDALIVNGDLVDGKANATELLAPDLNDQAAMAVEAIEVWDAPVIVMTYGTARHASGEGQEDVEDVIERLLAKQGRTVKLGAHEWLNVRGCIFDIKHHCGGSSIPHGRHTAIARERLWNVLWAEHEEQPRSKILVRSHVHYLSFAGDANWFGLTTPALQAMGSKFGSRRCSGHVDWGLVHFDVKAGGDYDFAWHTPTIPAQRARALTL